MVTREQYQIVYELYVYYDWTPGMIKTFGHGLKAWEVMALIEGIDEDLRKERRRKAREHEAQIEIFQMPPAPKKKREGVAA